MSIIDKAKELAELITNSEELNEIREAEKAMFNDEAANNLVQEFQQKQIKVNNAQMSGEEVGDELYEEIEAFQEKMAENPFIARYLSAQEKFNQTLASVNFIISKAISGDDDCSSGCGGGCGGGDCC
jgi:cell fate (sporulation/competence/biofilm development) regulator YlbF (YheA/YmcA/DUF963 family)